MPQITCNVASIEKLNTFLYRIFLAPTSEVDFKAGQYVSVVMGEKDKRHFSIANTTSSDLVELHIGATPENSYAMQVIDKMESGETIEVEIANGEAYLREASTRPIIIVAGGTGFAYAKSLMENIIELKLTNQVHLYWGVKESEHFYYADGAQAWDTQNENIHFHPVVELCNADWKGKTGYVHQAVLSDFSDLSDYDIYVVGRFEMAKVAREDFLKQAASLDNIYGDAFAFV